MSNFSTKAHRRTTMDALLAAIVEELKADHAYNERTGEPEKLGRRLIAIVRKFDTARGEAEEAD